MGNCQCQTDSTKEKLAQITNQDQCLQKTSQNQKESLNNEKLQLGQKKRHKVAFVNNEVLTEIKENVELKADQQITSSDIIEIKKTLKKHFIFSQLSEKQIDCFIPELKPCTTKKDQYVFKQGDKSGAYYIILEGICQIIINEEKKRTITFGDSFGDLGIVYNAPRSASVYTLTDCCFVSMSRKVFKKVMEDINNAYEQQNKKILSVLSFFKELNEEQKNAIASTCLTETYEEGQVIFNKGDDANSFYIIKEGKVIIKQKNIELKQMDSFGQNSILVDDGVRTNTLVAKTKCKIVSMSRENVTESLGGNIKNIIRKNMVWKIVSESPLYKQNLNLKWQKAFSDVEDISFKKGQTIFKKSQMFKNVIYVNLNSKLTGANTQYEPNSIVEQKQLIQNKKFMIPHDIVSQEQGHISKIAIELQPKSIDSRSSIHNPKQKVDKDPKSILEDRMSIADFHVIRKLRSGNFGQVYVCFNNKTQKIYAVKVLDRSYVEKAQIIQYVMNEEQILRTAPHHPFLVSFYKLIKDNNFIYFVMEYIQGEDLFDTITKIVSFTQEQTKFLVSQILLVLQHLHTNKIIYRDLKPQNLMMCTNGYLKLVDMGTAKKLKIQRRYKTNTIIGTPHYMAPEIITGKGYSFQVDLWSLGVIMYELICGKLPFGEHSQDPFSIYQQIVNSTLKYPRKCERHCKILIEKLLSRSPQYRIANGYGELKKHPFFAGVNWENLLKKEEKSFYSLDQTYNLTKLQIQKQRRNEKNKVPDRFMIDKVSR